jgi:roadblock/LC7 domain-containing protein
MFKRLCLGVLLLAGLVLSFNGCNTSSTSGTSGLTTIVISPTTVSVTLMPPGTQQGQSQFTAIGYYGHAGHQSTRDITSEVTWSSSLTQVAGINSSGLATATGYSKTTGEEWTGNTNITASAPGYNGTIVSNSATFTVTSCTSCSTDDVSAITVLPATQTVASLNVPVQFEAIGTTIGGSTVVLTGLSGIQWTSSVPSIASIDATSGVATTVGAGTTTITATYTNSDGSGASGTATLTVATATSTEPLTALTVSPTAQTALVVGQTAQFLAIATTSSSTYVNLTNQTATVNGNTIKAAVWTSSNPSVASIDSATGIAKSLAAGVSVITAIATNPDGSVVTGASTYTVTVSSTSSSEPLVSLTIVPSSQTLTTAGQTANLIVIGTTSNGTTVNLTNQTATIGTSTIQAATWSTSVKSVATIGSATGIAAAVANGTTAITAIASNPDGTVVTGVGTVTVDISATAEPLLSLAIIPNSVSVAYPGQTGQLTAIGTTSSSTTVNLTNQSATVGTVTIPAVVWSSSNTAVATVDSATGLVTAKGEGTAVILAIATNTDNSVVTATSTFAVQNAATEPVASLTVIPNSQSIASNQTAQFIALGTDGTTGLESDLTTAVTWSSSNIGAATVGLHTGLITGVSAGSTTITAEYTNPATSTTAAATVSASASVTITAVTATPEPLQSLSVIPTSQTITAIDETAQFLAIGTTSTGAQEDLTNSVAWSSSEINVATINTSGTSGTTTGGTGEPAGLATVLAAGTTAITAVATNTDGTVVTAVATLTCPSGTSSSTSGSITTVTYACSTTPPAEQQATLTVVGMGSATSTGTWLVTAPSATGAVDAIHCGPGSSTASPSLGDPVCSATYPVDTTGLLLTTTVPAGGSYTFGGWSANCTPTAAITATGTNTCTVTSLSNDETVAAIFNVVI